MKNPTSSKLKDIIENGETQRVEFKESEKSGLDKEMVAFANSLGGKIYIGITDKGEIKGINITNRLKSQIYDLARNCGDIPISIQEMKKENILVVTVKTGEEKPYSCSSGFYLRKGSNSQKLNKSELMGFIEDAELIEFDTAKCKNFIYKKHFDKKKLFSFLDRTGANYKGRPVLDDVQKLGEINA